jgi:NADPH-dependent glutamate synthase beta subunit-like oxidoreductase
MSGNLPIGLSDNIVIDKTRCIFCGVCVETCITDNLRLLLAPCRHACPLHTNCQGYVQAVARGDPALALEIVHGKLPFPAILGRVCPHPCEASCTRRATDGQAVAIREIKRFIADRVPVADYPVPERAAGTGKVIAVVGAGPAGLLSAYDLALRGHDVRLYDSEPEPGGMLRWAIPAFRLPDDELRAELGQLERLGVRFRGRHALGRELSLDGLMADHDAVVVAIGRGSARELAGFEANGEDVHGGLPFLRAHRCGEAPGIGSAVLVVGGGNVAIDAARTARRRGAETVRLVCLEARAEMPAYAWEVRAAEAEGVEIRCGLGPVALRRERGALTGVVCRLCVSLWDERGAFSPRLDAGSEILLEADTVIVAIGQQADAELLGRLGLDGEVDPLTLQLGDRPVFLAGDLVDGPASVVEAMASGRRAAESAHRFVAGAHMRYGRTYVGPIVTDFDVDTSGAPPRPRAELRQRAAAAEGFEQADEPLDPVTARQEAERCHSCGQPVGFYRTCWFCLPCEVECPRDALWVEVPYLLR